MAGLVPGRWVALGQSGRVCPGTSDGVGSRSPATTRSINARPCVCSQWSLETMARRSARSFGAVPTLALGRGVGSHGVGWYQPPGGWPSPLSLCSSPLPLSPLPPSPLSPPPLRGGEIFFWRWVVGRQRWVEIGRRWVVSGDAARRWVDVPGRVGWPWRFVAGSVPGRWVALGAAAAMTWAGTGRRDRAMSPRATDGTRDGSAARCAGSDGQVTQDTQDLQCKHAPDIRGRRRRGLQWAPGGGGGEVNMPRAAGCP